MELQQNQPGEDTPLATPAPVQADSPTADMPMTVIDHEEPEARTELPVPEGLEGVEGPDGVPAEEEHSDGWNRKADQVASVRQDFEVMSPLDKPWDPSQVLLSLPSDTKETIQAALAARPNINIADTKQGGEWLNNLRMAQVAVSYNGMLQGTVDRQGGSFRQGVMSEKGILTAGNVKFKDTGEAKLTGERAVLRVRALMGMGSVIRVPLWHSGFWVTIKAPSEASLLELNRRLTQEKITLGRSTFGMAFANTSVFFASWVMDFVISHIYDSTLNAEAEANLREHICAEDIPLLAWGIACVIWTGGFPYARAVLDPAQGEKVIKEKLNIGKLLWVDNSSLTPWQIAHMSKIHGQHHTVADLEKYRKEFTRGQGRELVINENLSFMLRSPKMDQYLNSGTKWINNIVHMVDETFNRTDNDQVRDSYIWEQGQATNMRQYAHYVESIKIGDGEYITDEETIESIIDTLSSDKDVREKYFDGVQAYIRDSLIAIVAIPATENEDRATLPRFPNLLVLDTLSVFFTLLVQKIPQIRDR